MRRARIVFCALALVLGLILGACGGDAEPAKPIRTVEPQRTASSPSVDPSDAKDSPGCKLINAKERESIAGENISLVPPGPSIEGVLSCTWVKTLSTPLTTSIKVVSQPVQKWVQSVPKRIDRLIQEGRTGRNTKRLQATKKKIIVEKDKITDEEACDVFALLVEINEDRKNASEFILYQGTPRGDYTVAWHRCGGGVHTEFVYTEPGLQVSLALTQSVIRLGKVAHKRAVKRL